MSKSKQLVRAMSILGERTEDLCTVLQRYKRVSADVAAGVEQGDSLAAILEALRGPVQRRDVTEALQEFEVARHRVRLAMFALAKEQGTSMSELGRQLGISRQLASRLAAEAQQVRP